MYVKMKYLYKLPEGGGNAETYNNNIYYLRLGRHPVAGVILYITLYMHGL